VQRIARHMQTIINVMSSDTDDRAAAILVGSLVEASLNGPIAFITRPPTNGEEYWVPLRC
jgi:hypothetical protein